MPTNPFTVYELEKQVDLLRRMDHKELLEKSQANLKNYLERNTDKDEVSGDKTLSKIVIDRLNERTSEIYKKINTDMQKSKILINTTSEEKSKPPNTLPPSAKVTQSDANELDDENTNEREPLLKSYTSSSSNIELTQAPSSKETSLLTRLRNVCSSGPDNDKKTSPSSPVELVLPTQPKEDTTKSSEDIIKENELFCNKLNEKLKENKHAEWSSTAIPTDGNHLSGEYTIQNFNKGTHQKDYDITVTKEKISACIPLDASDDHSKYMAKAMFDAYISKGNDAKDLNLDTDAIKSRSALCKALNALKETKMAEDNQSAITASM